MKPTAQPGDDLLKGFLLGTLAPSDSAAVSAWLESDPDAHRRLRAIEARDTVVEGLAETGIGPDERAPSAPDWDRTSVRPTAPELTVDPVPVQLGGYRVLAELGRGGMGVVYEAQDETLGRRVALKVIASDVATNPTARARFVSEARAAAGVEHPGVVPVLHVGEDAGRPFLVMPLLKGETLDERLKRDGRLPPRELIRLTREVASALAAAHAAGLVHRDIKPANIWLEAGTGRAIVLDFGLAKRTDATANGLTETGAVVGTPHYMSPEQAEGHPVDARTDLFSLGAVLYHAATGERPFKGDTKLSVLIAVTKEHPKRAERLNPALPSNLVALLARLLEKRPENRPASALDVLSALDERPVVPVRRTRWAVAVAVLGTAALVVAGIIVIVRDKNGREIARYEVPEGGGIEVRETPPPKQPAPKPAAPPANERAAAEWVLSKGGIVIVNGSDRRLTKRSELPAGPLTDMYAVLEYRTNLDADGFAVFRDCQALVWFNAHSTNISDDALAHMSGCTNLRALDLHVTDVSDTGLAHLKRCSKLEHLNLAVARRVSDAGLAHFAGCTDLTFLSVHGTRVTDRGLAPVREFKRLTYFSMAETKSGNAALEHLRGCKALEHLHLDDSAVTDDGLKLCANWPALAELRLEGLPITDAGLKHLYGVASLRELRLARTRATAAGVAALAKALPKCRIHWSGGTIEPAQK